MRWALAELGLSYEHVPLGGRYGGTRTPEYLAMNPNGLVPTLRDGDLVLWESHAILRYLSATYGVGTLWPADPRDREHRQRRHRAGERHRPEHVQEEREGPRVGTGDRDDAVRLNLITCDGMWVKSGHTYDERLVVYTTLAK